MACVLLGVLAIGAVAALAASGLPGLGPGVEGEETQGPAGILGILDVRDRLPDVSAGRPSTEIGSQFLAGAAERLGLGNMPAGALPAAARAYRSQFGHSMDEDLPEHQDAIEEWLLTWRAAYDAGASWATGMAGP